jgi:hypothetical protein
MEKPNIKLGDIVFEKDKGLARNDWPVGIVKEAIKSDDNLVRKAVVRKTCVIPIKKMKQNIQKL